MSALGISDQRVREIARMTKGQLAERILLWNRQHGRRIVYGGPQYWSKDELVSAVIRIERGEEP